MTDPLSVSASIAGLVTLADIVFRRTYKYVKAVKKAPKEISALSDEINSLYGVLRRLQLVSRELEDETFDTSTRIHHVQSCFETLENVESILDKDDTSSLHDQRLETFKRKLRWPFTSSEVKHLIAEIERHKATLGLALNVDCMSGLVRALSRQDEIRSTVEGIRTELKEKHEAETRIAINKETQEILKSFAKVDPYSNHNMNRKLRSPGTGLWLTESQEFKQWTETRNAKLWYYGIPGAGKTVLASSVIEEALRISNPSTSVAFFYCDYKDPATQDLSNILGSLAQQFAKQDEDSFTKLRDFYKAHNPELQSNVMYDSDALSTLVKEVASVFDSAMIIVDGLDECGRNASVVVDALAALNEVDHSTIKTIFLSRDEIDIRERLEDYTMVSIAARSSDLKLYVGAEIEIRMRKKRLRLKDQSLKEHILERLVGGAEGMFRWVTCQMDYLCELPNDAARRVALGSLPPNLNSTYERILKRVNQGSPETQKLVRRALRWIANDIGSSDLTIEALCEAVSIDFGSTRRNPEAIPDEFEILHRCSSLVRKSENGKKLELAHFTVKEFLQQIDPQRDLSVGGYRVNADTDGIALAKVCLTYLNFEDFNHGRPEGPSALEYCFPDCPFRRHAVNRWTDNAVDNLNDSEVVSLVKKLLNPSKPNTFISWMHDDLVYTYDYYELQFASLVEDTDKLVVMESFLAEATALHYAVLCQLPEICSWLIGSGCDVNRNTEFGTPLHFAILKWLAFPGRYESPLDNGGRSSDNVFSDNSNKVIALLLDSGADPNCDYSAGTVQLSPLFMALSLGRWNLALQLLDKGGRIDDSCLEVLENHSRCEDVCRLIEHAGDHNVVQGNRTRLFQLVLRGKTPNAARLVPQKKDLFRHNTHCEQSLRTAAEYGQVEIISDLLENHSLDINAADEGTGLTALHYAAKTDQVEIAQILINHGAELSKSEKLGRTALHCCVQSRGVRCLRLLLQQNADNRLQDLAGMTVWHLAAQEGNVQALSVLLSMNVGPGHVTVLKTNDGKTPLLCASAGGSKQAVDLLLNAGSSLADTASDGSSPLHYAAGSGSLESVEFLMEKEVLSDLVTNDGSTAIHYAVAGPWENVAGKVRILIEYGVDPCKARNDGCTPLHVLVSLIKGVLHEYGGDSLDKYFTAGQKLLEKMLENLRSECSLRLGSELIYLASSSSLPHVHEVVLALLEYGLDTNVTFANGKTAFMAAAERGNDKILGALLTHGADPSITDDSGLNAVHFACSNGHINVLVLLRNTSIDWSKESTAKIVNAEWRKKVTPLHIAAQSNDSRVLEYLLNQGLALHLDACTDKGETPLSLAVWQSTPENVSLLLSKEADTTIMDEYGNSAVHWAAAWGLKEVIAEFIEHGSDLGLLNSCGLTPEFVARKYGYENLGKTIMDYVNVQNNETDALTHNQTSSQNYGTSEALKVAIDIGDIELCTRIIQSGTDLEAGFEGCPGCTPLLYSLHKGQPSISKYLVSRGCSIKGSTCAKWETRGFTSLHYAAAYGDVELLRLLLERGPSEVFLNNDPIHPMHVAVLRNNVDCVKLILDHVSQGKGRNPSDQLGTLEETLGRTVNEPVRAINFDRTWCGRPFPQDLTGATPLHIAARNGNPQIGSVLLARGASIDSVDGKDATPLHDAADQGSIAMVKLLLEAGANPNMLDWNLHSPAMRAAAQGHVHCVRVLLEAGADIQLRDNWGQTILHLAVRARARDMFIFLMSKTSVYELATEDRSGQSVLHHAWCDPLAFPTSFLLSLAPPAAVYMSQNRSILNAAICDRSIMELKILLRRIPTCLLPRLLDQREPGWGTPLHVAAIHERLDIMTLLLDTGAQLEIEACEHGTALMGACAIGRLASVKFLVARGARTSYMQDGQLYSALLAAKYHPEVKRWLLVGRFVEGPKLLAYKDVEEDK